MVILQERFLNSTMRKERKQFCHGKGGDENKLVYHEKIEKQAFHGNRGEVGFGVYHEKQKKAGVHGKTYKKERLG